MNYIVEDKFDFYGELNNDTPIDISSNAICMISHKPLTYNSITLPCKHSFNYLPLYSELCLHNNKQYISCPYCRIKLNKLIPFIPLPSVTKVYGVNYPTKMSMPLPKCSFLLNSGMYKGVLCEQSGMEYEHGVFCSKHVKFNINNTWTPEKEEIFKSKTVVDLKKILREKGLRVGGVKKELVNRLFAK
jgi:hypothetical protein